jgi:hypothetical protein
LQEQVLQRSFARFAATRDRRCDLRKFGSHLGERARVMNRGLGAQGSRRGTKMSVRLMLLVRLQRLLSYE